MSDLERESHDLLDLERAEGEPTALELETRRVAVFASLGIPLPTPDASTPAVPSAESASAPTVAASGAGPGTASGISIGAKLSIVGLVAITGAAGYFASRPAPSPDRPRIEARPSVAIDEAPRSASVTSMAPEATQPSAPQPETRPASPRAEQRSAQPIPRERVAESVVPIENHEPPPDEPPVAASPADTLSEESMLVAAAEAQLRAGHAAEALSLFDRALARHATGSLRVESLAGRIISLCRLGRTPEGRQELERFLASYPRSPSAPRLRAACGVEP